MDDWIRIGDDEIALFGKHTLKFSFPFGQYSIIVDHSNQDYLTIKFQGNTEHWPIDRKDRKGDEFKLSGTADWIPELMDDYCWFELLLGSREPTITYWGDHIVYRIDRSIPLN